MYKSVMIALAGMAGVSGAAMAQETIAVTGGDGFRYDAQVAVSDLNLMQAKGKVALRARVKQAVQLVCAEDAECNYTTERASARDVANAIASANGQLAMATPTHLTVSGAR
jgi:UrcA family protein